MTVRNIVGHAGNPVRNQFIIQHEGKTFFQSYDSLIAVYDGDALTLGRHWDYSVTTLKYLGCWLEDWCWRFKCIIDDYTGSSRAARIRKAISDGVIIYDPAMV